MTRKERTPEELKRGLRYKVRIFYDLQRLRMQAQGREKRKAKGAEIQLHPSDKADLKMLGERLREEEKVALSVVQRHLREIPFYREVLTKKDRRWQGLGPTMAGVILSEFDIHKATTPSKMWAFAGLNVWHAYRCNLCHRVVDEAIDMPGTYSHRPVRSKRGESEDKKPKTPKCVKAKEVLRAQEVYSSGEKPHHVKGQKAKYNSYLRTRMWVLAGVLVRKVSYSCISCGVRVKKLGGDDEEEGIRLWRHPRCQMCSHGGEDVTEGQIVIENGYWRQRYLDYKHRKESQRWGVSQGHRDSAARRYVVKQLLLEVWKEWRAFEGLEVRAPYQEEYLGHEHVVNE